MTQTESNATFIPLYYYFQSEDHGRNKHTQEENSLELPIICLVNDDFYCLPHSRYENEMQVALTYHSLEAELLCWQPSVYRFL